jgi:hypothetical protein
MRFLLRKTASVTSLQPANLLRKSAFRSVHRYRCNSGFLIGLFRQSRKDELTFNARLKGGL